MTSQREADLEKLVGDIFDQAWEVWSSRLAYDGSNENDLGKEDQAKETLTIVSNWRKVHGYENGFLEKGIVDHE